jgi:drug/metabolite transporter (DMT)-like permease
VTPLTLLLVLSAGAIHALWNLWAKQLSDSARSVTLLWTFTALSCAIYLPIALVAGGAMAWRPTLADLGWIAGSGVIHVGYFFLLVRGYRTGDLSLVYPIARGTGPLLAAAGAVAWFGERPTPLAILGALAIAAGIAILMLRPGVTHDPRAGAGVRWGLAAGVSIAVYTLWDAWTVSRVRVPPLLFYAAGELVRVLVLTPWMLRDRPAVVSLWRAHKLRVLGIAALSPLSYILVLLAFRDGAVSHVAPAREVSILVGAFLGGTVLGEGQRVRRRVAAAAFVAGVVSLALA